ncbi:MAG: CvpA family protein [Azonexaceae bacterium]|uniref:CvpA family protein n=1 Tax=Azonexus sp. R2A61 TaxID=2744443 RepID=UPI001F22F097|nr:CvpA family protein [Azonexus sp. R2A61]MCE1241120.1 CvpA family protein [Azonexaceae bacterium]
MTIFDYVAITVIVLSLGFGLWRGMVSEMIALAAWGLGIFAAFRFGVEAGAAVFSGVEDPTGRALLGCVLIFVGVLVAMAIVRILILKAVKALGLTVSDRLLGMFFGVVRGVLIILVLVALGGMTAAPTQPWWREATLAPPLETAVLALKPLLPHDLSKRIRFS